MKKIEWETFKWQWRKRAKEKKEVERQMRRRGGSYMKLRIGKLRFDRP